MTKAPSFALLITPLALVVGLSGCSIAALVPHSASTSQSSDSAQSQALDRYAAEERETLPEVKKQNPGVYSDLGVTVTYPGTIIYSYTYATELDAKATAKALDGLVDQLKDAADNTIFPAMKKTGVTGPLHATFVYNNSDGKLIWTKTFSSSD